MATATAAALMKRMSPLLRTAFGDVKHSSSSHLNGVSSLGSWFSGAISSPTPSRSISSTHSSYAEEVKPDEANSPGVKENEDSEKVAKSEGTHKSDTETGESIPNVSAEEEDRSKILVIGGNGFVGSEICKQAVSSGLNVMSLNRSGIPTISEPWVYEVDWIKGNALEPENWKHVLQKASSVISCLGAFGSNDYMKKINGDANVNAIRLAHESGVKRFVFVSAHDFGFPSFVLRGYFQGKKATEEALRNTFPYGGVILRPGMIHGVRRVGNVQLPLNLIGSPLEAVIRHARWATRIPLVGPLVAPPVSVRDVAKTSLRAATDNAFPPGIVDVWDIPRLANH